jgi:transcriptional regulator GlxA family with amidase domain
MRSGLSLVADAAWRDVKGPIDTLVVAGGDCRALMEDRALLAWIRRVARHARRTTSVCTGAFLLAEAGLLDGRRATTHWGWVDELRRRYPAVAVDPDALFVSDGAIHTSAGVTAGMDLALALVEADLGRSLALDVARGLVLFLKRPGGQSQFSAHLAAQRADRGPLGDVPEWIVQHLDGDLSVETLAARAAMSPRNFARVFARELGVTPAKFVERARIEQARRALEDGELPLASVAEAAGFGSLERMRRTFHRHLRVVPQAYRNRFKAALVVAD